MLWAGLSFAFASCYNTNKRNELCRGERYGCLCTGQGDRKAQGYSCAQAYTIPDEICSLRQLLTAVVRKETAQYNSRAAGAQLIPLLTQQELDDRAEVGKVSFGTIYSDRKADIDRAVANAIQCWEDGLVRVFMNEEELTALDAPLKVEAQAVLTFLRLAFLSGSIW